MSWTLLWLVAFVVAFASFVLGALASLGYLVPWLRLDVATAGNLSWALAVAGFVLGSVLAPPAAPRQEAAA